MKTCCNRKQEINIGTQHIIKMKRSMQALHHLMQMTAVESQIYKLKFELTCISYCMVASAIWKILALRDAMARGP